MFKIYLGHHREQNTQIRNWHGNQPRTSQRQEWCPHLEPSYCSNNCALRNTFEKVRSCNLAGIRLTKWYPWMYTLYLNGIGHIEAWTCQPKSSPLQKGIIILNKWNQEWKEKQNSLKCPIIGCGEFWEPTHGQNSINLLIQAFQKIIFRPILVLARFWCGRLFLKNTQILLFGEREIQNLWFGCTVSLQVVVQIIF